MIPDPEPHPTGAEPARSERRDVPTGHLDAQTRLNITRWAEEYITGLVEHRHGDRDDVRAIIHDLHYRTNVSDAG